MNLRIWPAVLFVTATLMAVFAQQPMPRQGVQQLSASQAGATPQASGVNQPRLLVVTVGKSLLLESPVDVQRVAIVTEDILEVVAINSRELVLNGKGPGETSMIVWQKGGNRLMFDVSVQPAAVKPVKDEKLTALVEGLKSEIRKELGDQDVSVSYENNAVFLRGTVRDLSSAQRAEAIAAMFGKPVNLLRVATPPGAAQILIKVKFADVNRSVGSDFGMNLLSTGAGNTIGRVTTGQYSAPSTPSVTGSQTAAGTSYSLSDALNIFLFQPSLNLGATIKMLQSQSLLQILAEPNLLTSDGKKASFLSGGEFPYPVVQSSLGGTPTITIQFREFGIRLSFTPTITPRGTINLVVAPEVSSLDYVNGLVYQGFNIPGIDMQKVSTEVELKDGQSFAIAGLLDNRLTENLSKIPGLASIPLFGKLFQSRSQTRSKTELLVVVTPEIVRPVPQDQPEPGLTMPKPFIQQGAATAPRTPGVGSTGAEIVKPMLDSVPVENLLPDKQSGQGTPGAPTYQLVPVLPTGPAVSPQPKPGEGGN
jgi:pilus assembly protein CpaC